MPTKHRGSLLRNSSSRLRTNRFLNTTRPSPSTPCRPKTSFARSILIVVTFIIGPSSLPRFGWSSLPSWPFKRPFQIVGLGPFHQYRFTFVSPEYSPEVAEILASDLGSNRQRGFSHRVRQTCSIQATPAT